MSQFVLGDNGLQLEHVHRLSTMTLTHVVARANFSILQHPVGFFITDGLPISSSERSFSLPDEEVYSILPVRHAARLLPDLPQLLSSSVMYYVSLLDEVRSSF